jgi:hypothetical protein
VRSFGLDPQRRGRLVQARADVEVLATTAEADPLLGAAERDSRVRRYAPALLDAFTFRSARAQDPLLTAIDLLRQLNRDDRRGLPAKVPLGHLIQKVRKLIAANGKRDRRLWEIATLAVLRERLRSGDVWVEGGRAFRPLETQLMPSPAFEARKEASDLRLGVPMRTPGSRKTSWSYSAPPVGAPGAATSTLITAAIPAASSYLGLRPARPLPHPADGRHRG